MSGETGGGEAAPPNPIKARWDQAFPRLTPAQIARLEGRGKRSRTRPAEVLVEPGERHPGLFVILSGSVEVVRPGLAGEELIVVHMPGQFSGEMSSLRGLGSVVRARVREDGEILAIDDENLRAILQADAELSEILMRAFILRRVGLIASQSGDVILIGSRHSAGTLRLQQFLTRNAFPYVSIDVEKDPSAQALLDRFHVSVDDIPVVLCRGEKMLKNPGNEEIAACLGMNPQIDDAKVRDLVVIGAGPAGLAAAVYGASEGLDVLVLAQKFGAEVTIASSAVRLRCEQRPYEIDLSNRHVVRARTIVVATGAEYRRLALENLDRFQGVGVYYAATPVEARLCKAEEIIVVGGGNSAGQAAVFLAGGCRHVHMLVRSGGLSDSMSRYLIRRIEQSPNITLHVRTQISALEGDERLERVTWRSGGESETREIKHVFLMTGAVPNTRWLQGCIALDDKGFVRTGSDLHADDLVPAQWAHARAPHLFETNWPGIFAVGDVRCGSTKRVAAAVGEGSACVQLVHRVLHE